MGEPRESSHIHNRVMLDSSRIPLQECAHPGGISELCRGGGQRNLSSPSPSWMAQLHEMMQSRSSGMVPRPCTEQWSTLCSLCVPSSAVFSVATLK